MIRVAIPTHLRRLADTGSEVTLEIEGQPTLGAVLDALEDEYPVLRGTLRDHATKQRRPFIRFFACGEDWSHEPADAPPAGTDRQRGRAPACCGRHGRRFVRIRHLLPHLTGE